MSKMMASAISIPTLSYSSYTARKSTVCTSSSSSSSSSSLALYPTAPRNGRFQLGLTLFMPWNGLKHLGISISQKSVRIVRKSKSRGKVVYASLFGVGAPEALVIGVVALLVFGPKGLAEVARNLGKTLRAFQPTIRELQDVSREFKSSLEREIGLDDIPNSTQNTYNSNRTTSTSTPSSTAGTEDSTAVGSNGSLSPKRAYTTEEYLKITEEQLKASTAQQQTPPLKDNQLEPQNPRQGVTVQESADEVPESQEPERKT